MQNKSNSKYETGITLVALVVTIIVLLVLAGVSIKLAFSNDGIIVRAEEASNLYENASEEDQEAIDDFSNKLARLREARHSGQTSGDPTPTPTQTPTTTPAPPPSSNITIKDSEGTTIDLANIASYYGHNVRYNEKTFQLFFVDLGGKYSNGEPRIWLQHRNYVDGVTLNDHLETTGITTANSMLWKLNPDLDTRYGYTIRSLDDWDNNLKGTAYLCNPNNWNSTYVASEDIASGAFAVGGVSAEMFCDSYNQARGKTSTDAGYFDAKAFNKYNTYGYYYKPKHSDNSGSSAEGDYGLYTDDTNYPLPSTSEYGGIYRPASGQYQFLASPSSGSATCVCSVDFYWGRLKYNMTDYAYGVRPAVSLPASMILQLTN